MIKPQQKPELKQPSKYSYSLSYRSRAKGDGGFGDQREDFVDADLVRRGGWSDKVTLQRGLD